MTDAQFDAIVAVHLKGAYSMTKAVWPLMRQQKFGRVINTASPAGVYGNLGQANYSAAKMGLTAFSKSLSMEGAKYNITSNAIVPVAASAMTATVMPEDVLRSLSPDHIAPLVGVLTAKNGPKVAGRIFELGAGFYSELRWERAEGVIYKTDSSFTASAVAARWGQVMDFTRNTHPVPGNPEEMSRVIEAQPSLPPNAQGPKIDYKGKTVIITGAGAGLGRTYALYYATLGANVVVNDVSKANADAVVAEVNAAGGKGVAAVCSAEEGDAIVKAGLDAFGSVHALVCNAGILRDKAFVNMTEAMWDDVIKVHLRGTYRCCKAVWPIFQAQKFGRILVTASPNAVYGAHGQANYGTAKAAIIGFCKTLAIEGSRANVLVNCIAPRAGTAMTATVWPKEMLETFKPEFVAPVVAFLTSPECTETGTFYETFGGFAAQMRWERTQGVAFPNDKPVSPEELAANWDKVTSFKQSTHPASAGESFIQISENFGTTSKPNRESEINEKDTEEIKHAKRNPPQGQDFTYTQRDVMLYNLGIGAHATELNNTYENAESFGALPTFGVVPQFISSSTIDLGKIVPNFNPAKLLHGEQYLKIHGPIPTEGTLTNEPRIFEALDKGKAASVTTIVETRDKATGKLIFENHSTVFIRGSGGFGGQQKGDDRGAATAANAAPKRAPDAVVEEKTSEDQAAIYRLSGDYNPLHIDPQFAAIGGFKKPILHGLCSMGFAGRHIIDTYGPFSDIKVRFVGTVVPGETLVTEMWKEGDKVLFQVKVKERDAPALANAAVTLVNGGQLKSKL